MSEAANTNTFIRHLRKVMPQLFEKDYLCPYAEAFGPRVKDYGTECEYGDVLPWIMVHLNDYHYWTRERIAEWLELMAEQNGIDITFPVPEDGVDSDSHMS